MKKIVIVGGGTAGWITALFIQKKIKDIDITVVESSEIGILGAGEGTTPHFKDFLNLVDINPDYVIKRAKGSIKLGIKFTNWNGDGASYFHPFYEGDFKPSENVFSLAKGLDNNLDNICLSHHVSELNRLKFRHVVGSNQIDIDGFHAYHFDAREIADLLKEVGQQRNIKVIDDVIDSFDQDSQGNIYQINLNKTPPLQSDFVFDCSGFHRLIVGKLFNTEWVSSSKALPADRAFPFFLTPDNKSIPPYTEAIAMKYGWVWKIPLQERYGCGYVYDSKYITNQQAKEEILSLFPNATFPREEPFKFSAGNYKDTWVNNCIALGLSSGFFEPLEATSIWATIHSLITLCDNCLPGLFNRDKNYIDSYNKIINKSNLIIENFLQLHYITKRNDTEFWKNFKEHNKIHSEFEILQSKKTPHEYEFYAAKIYSKFNPMWVICGLELHDKKQFKNHIRYNHYDLSEKLVLEEKLRTYAELSAIDHLSYINFINRRVTVDLK